VFSEDELTRLAAITTFDAEATAAFPFLAAVALGTPLGPNHELWHLLWKLIDSKPFPMGPLEGVTTTVYPFDANRNTRLHVGCLVKSGLEFHTAAPAVKLQDLLTQVFPSGSEEAFGTLTATVKEAVASMGQGQILQAAEGIADHVRSAVLAQLSKHWKTKLTADPASSPLTYPAQTALLGSISCALRPWSCAHAKCSASSSWPP
jgi:hypothetical protein